VDPQAMATLLQTGAMGALITLVVWVVRRTFTHTIPRLATDFKEALSKQADAFSKQLEDQREDFKSVLAEQREDFKESLKEERDNLGKKLDRLAEAVDLLTAQQERHDHYRNMHPQDDHPHGVPR